MLIINVSLSEGTYIIMKRLSTILILILALVLSSCGKTEATTEETVTKYNVDYCGSRECYIGAKDSYSPGKEVKMYYDERTKSFISDENNNKQIFKFSKSDIDGNNIEIKTYQDFVNNIKIFLNQY